MRPPFRFRHFAVAQDAVVHPVGTDGVLLGAWAPVQGATRILDIGGGSGVVALMLAQRTQMSNAPIVAVEVHAGTHAQMLRNFAASPWADRLTAHQGAVQEFEYPSAEPFDLIVSNPPFFTELTVSPDPERRWGRDTQALSPADLIHALRRLLSPKGRAALVLPALEGRRFVEMAAIQGLYCTEEVQIHSRPQKPVERLLLEFRRDPYAFRRSSWSLHPAVGEARSAEFAALTADFYW